MFYRKVYVFDNKWRFYIPDMIQSSGFLENIFLFLVGKGDAGGQAGVDSALKTSEKLFQVHMILSISW